MVGFAFAQTLPPGGTFTDDDGNIHEGNIEAIAAEGITKGCNPPLNTLYCPGDSVTRAQMAAFLNRALGLAPGTGNTFVDDDGSIFEPDIEALAAAGITKGCNPPDNDEYCPGDPVRRDQMASFLSRALGLTPIIPPPPTTSTTTTTTTTAPPATFGSGTWIVGTDISPGTYRNSTSVDGCYWARPSGFGGTLDDIITNDFRFSRTIVEISASDAGFESNRCGTWSTDLTPITPSPSSPFSDGVYQVGPEVGPGLWRNSDSADGCYWARLSSFSGELDDIIINDFTFDISTVMIDGTDVGFESNRCGTWTKIG